jgi:hypothetical protein
MIKDVEYFFNHPLIIGEKNEKWTLYKDRQFPEGNQHGGCIDFYPECISESKRGVEYIIKILNEYKPKRILEIGTNIGSFDIIVQELLPDCEVFTIDLFDFSERVTEINDYFGNKNIKFYKGDSTSFAFRSWIQHHKFDLAWIDANHSYDYIKNDIQICVDYKIPLIVLDDCSEKSYTDVNKVRKEFKELIEIGHSESPYLGAISLNKLII